VSYNNTKATGTDCLAEESELDQYRTQASALTYVTSCYEVNEPLQS